MNNSTPCPTDVPGFRNWLSDPLALVGLIVGLTPVLAGLIFRTYLLGVTPGWAEILRQIDMPFIFIELLTVMWARHNGFLYLASFRRLDKASQVALVVFLSSFWISSAFISAEPAYSMIRASYWFVHIAFGFAVFHLAGVPTRRGLFRCGAALLAGLVLFLPLMAAHFITAPEPATLRGGAIIWSSAIPGCLSVRHLGIWAASVLACGIGVLFMQVPKLRGSGVVYAAIFIATAVLCWSGTRAGLYGVIGALLIVSATLRTLPPPRVVLNTAAAVVLGVVVGELWLPESSFGLIHRVSGVSNADLQSFSSGRTVLWAAMIDAFFRSPVFGVGEGAVNWLAVLEDYRHVQPHNSVVQMLSSWGLIACAAAAYLLNRLLLSIHRLARRDDAIIPIVVMIDCLLIMSLADGVLYFSRFIMLFAAGAAVALAAGARGYADTISSRQITGLGRLSAAESQSA